MPQKLICIFAGTAGSMINSLKLVTETIRWEVRGPYGQRAAKYEAANSSHMVESQRVAKIASKCGRTQTIIGRPSTLPKSSLFGQKVSACVCTVCTAHCVVGIRALGISNGRKLYRGEEWPGSFG